MIFEDVARYEQLRNDLRTERNAYKKRAKPIRDELALLEADIKSYVMETKESIQVGSIKIEYVPTVVINVVKEKKETE